MNRRLVWAAAAAAAAVLACRSSSSAPPASDTPDTPDAPPTPPPNPGPLGPPTTPAATQLPEFDWVVITWGPPPPGFDSIRVEVQREDGSWLLVGDVPGMYRGVYLEFPADEPDCAQYHFRLSTVRGMQVSEPTAPFPYQRGVRPAGIVDVSASSDAAGWKMHVTWSPTALAADSVVVERQVVPYGSSSPTGAWTPFATLGADARSYDDLAPADWADGATPVYQVLYRCANGLSSTPNWGFGPYGRPRPVEDLVAETAETGTRLRWTNPNVHTTAVIVDRGSWRYPGLNEWPTYEDVRLSGDATGFTAPDQTLTSWGYEVRVEGPGGTSAPVRVQANTLPPALASDFEARTLLAPRFQSASGAPDVGFAFSSESATFLADAAGNAVQRHEGSGFNFYLLHPGALLGQGARVDAVHGNTHAWLDGDGWHEQEVTSEGFGFFHDGVLARGPGGVLHAVRNGFTAQYAFFDGTRWTAETLPGCPLHPTYFFHSVDVAVDPGGTPHVLLTRDDGSGEVLVRSGDGWTCSAFEATWPVANARYMHLAAPSSDVTEIFWAAATGSDVEPLTLAHRRLTASGWDPPEAVATLAPGTDDVVGTVATVDGTRLAVVAVGGVHLREPDGTYRALPFTERILGFTPAGKLWMIAGGRAELHALLVER